MLCDQLRVSGAVPPLADTVMLPFAAEHNVLVLLVMVRVGPLALLTATGISALQPLLSVTVTV